MRVAFAGTPRFAVPTLQCLIDAGTTIAAVYTQPDRPAGRGRRLTASPVKHLAEKHGLMIIQPTSLKDKNAAPLLNDLAVDVLIVVAYGLIIPEALLNVPKFGCVNVHASLLPRWRGAAPIARAIEAGDSVSGVTIMKLDSGLDTGPIIASRQVAINEQDNAGTLHDKLAQTGAELLLEVLPAYVNGEIQCSEQDHAGATYAPKLFKSEAKINWELSARRIQNQIRAYNPWPVAFTFHGDERIRILAAQISPVGESLPAGSICRCDRGEVHVACGEGVLRLTRLQRDGGKPLSTGEFLNGYPLRRGEILR